MGMGGRRLVRSFGVTALVALTVAGAVGYFGLREAVRCCPSTPLPRLTGTVALVAFRDAGRGLFPAMVAERVLEIRIGGNKTWFRYDNGWPHNDRLRRTIRHGDHVELGYGNCRKSFPGFRRCDIFEIAVSGGPHLTTAEEVSAARNRHARDLFLLGTLAAFTAVLFAALWGYGVARGVVARVAS